MSMPVCPGEKTLIPSSFQFPRSRTIAYSNLIIYSSSHPTITFPSQLFQPRSHTYPTLIRNQRRLSSAWFADVRTI
jgi:hypothetical protein